MKVVIQHTPPAVVKLFISIEREEHQKSNSRSCFNSSVARPPSFLSFFLLIVYANFLNSKEMHFLVNAKKLFILKKRKNQRTVKILKSSRVDSDRSFEVFFFLCFSPATVSESTSNLNARACTLLLNGNKQVLYCCTIDLPKRNRWIWSTSTDACAL